MPIYQCKVKGADKVRLVRAATAAQARDHIVSAETISAEDMDDLIAADPTLKVERAGQPATDPAAHAPGGDLHEPAGATGGEGAGTDKAAGKGGKEG